ncbi:g10433 [Coccomyxa elongata]
MMFGLFFSLKTFAAAMDPRTDTKSQLGAPLRIGESCTFRSFRTNNYKLHFLESPSGIKIVLNTDPNAGDLRDNLSYIYGLYVEYVMKNPLYTPGEPFKCELFLRNLFQFVKTIGL